ncbi:MAG TPA: hypothetical protein VN372_15215 [Methanospirillum sp.]|nr:hypothetical protein [Methanospirillum sp.]
MKPYFPISMIILIISVLGAVFFSDQNGSVIILFLFAELASLVSFYIFFAVVIPSLIPEYRNVDENFNCGASEIYLNKDEMYSLESPFGSVKDE